MIKKYFEKIEALRKRNNISKTNLSYAMGWAKNTYYMYSLLKQDMSFSRAEALANRFGYTLKLVKIRKKNVK